MVEETGWNTCVRIEYGCSDVEWLANRSRTVEKGRHREGSRRDLHKRWMGALVGICRENNIQKNTTEYRCFWTRLPGVVLACWKLKPGHAKTNLLLALLTTDCYSIAMTESWCSSPTQISMTLISIGSSLTAIVMTPIVPRKWYRETAVFKLYVFTYLLVCNTWRLPASSTQSPKVRRWERSGIT